jgi:hypothetical protein
MDLGKHRRTIWFNLVRRELVYNDFGGYSLIVGMGLFATVGRSFGKRKFEGDE